MSDQKPVLEGKGLVELLSKAAVDPGFRTELFANPAQYAKKYDLSLNDAGALGKIDPDEFARNVQSAGQNVSAAWAVGIGFHGTFSTK
jgi:hypothetical protein